MQAKYVGEPGENVPDSIEIRGLVFLKDTPTEIPHEIEKRFFRDPRFRFIRD